MFRNHLECDIERTNDFFLVKVQQVCSFHRVARSFNVSKVPVRLVRGEGRDVST